MALLPTAALAAILSQHIAARLSQHMAARLTQHIDELAHGCSQAKLVQPSLHKSAEGVA